MRAVIDTNVLLVANGQHGEVSPECMAECVLRLQAIQKSGMVVIDDGHRILGEYQKKTNTKQQPGVGDVFLKWLLRQTSNTRRVVQVSLTEIATDCFVEFPDPVLEPKFDPPDRKFAAVAYANPNKPSIWQAVDSKWLNWWPALQAKGVVVEFLCPTDVCQFYSSKFPGTPVPALPGDP